MVVMSGNTNQVAGVELSAEELLKRLAPNAVHDVRRLAGGASSLTYVATMGDGRDVVVKVAPARVSPTLNRDVLRQARLLRILKDTTVPVPDVLWEDSGDPPRSPPLFVMSYVEGSSLEPLFDLEGTEDIATVAERLRGAVRVMASMHRLDWSALGLRDEPVVGLTDEVDRWSRLLETVDASIAPGWQEVAAELLGKEPPALPPAILHGDFRLGNMLSAGPTIAAVIDWEIWTIGDPRVDLGWFLVNADPATYRRPTRYVRGLPAPDELSALYGEVPDLEWFRALACYKSTATWALIVKHNRRRPEPDSEVESMAGELPRLLEQARAWLRA
jgi:aminoglycoside phosphotransferase (APT) family kinase protein